MPLTDAQPIGREAAAFSPDPPARDLLQFWRRALGVSNWLGEDVFTALYESFVGRVKIPEETLNVIRIRPVIYIANHQVAVESLLFIFAMSGIAKSHVRALAKQAHRQSWVGELMGLLYTYPEAVAPPLSFFRDEYDPQSLVDLIAEMKSCLTDQDHSLLIHAEGARVLHCRRPISQLSMVFIDLAREAAPPSFR